MYSLITWLVLNVLILEKVLQFLVAVSQNLPCTDKTLTFFIVIKLIENMKRLNNLTNLTTNKQG